MYLQKVIAWNRGFKSRNLILMKYWIHLKKFWNIYPAIVHHSVYKTKNVDDWQNHAPGPLYVATCLPYFSWLQLQPVTVLPLGVGMGYSQYFAQRPSGPTDFSTIQSRRW